MGRIVRVISLLVMVSFSGPMVHAQTDRVIQRMFLVGDAGELKDGHHPVCDWLKQHVNWNDSSNVLVYLGDNVYPLGVPDDGSKGIDAAHAILDYQVSVVKDKLAKAYFVPGNHDWKRGRPGGWAQVKNEGAYLESLELPNVELLPKDGCPGPVSVEVGDKMVLVCMDSQWWLQQDDRPESEAACDCKDEKSIINALKDIIGTYPDKLIVLAMHHPFYTHGEHGGYYTIKQHIFPLTDMSPGLFIPLPLIGSIYPLSRQIFGNVQDTRSPRYRDLIGQVEDVIRGHSNVIHVAGHEHTLQLLQHDSTYFVVSGAGSKHTRVKMGTNSLFARSEEGFAVIELHESGKPGIRFYTMDAKDLDGSVYAASLPAVPVKEDAKEVAKTFPDSVTVAGFANFRANGFKRWLLGGNYRKEWAAPVRVKVFDMTGWKPLQRGGGLQTRSLRFKNKNGDEYVLRGVRKYVTGDALPAGFQDVEIVKDVVSDGVSASYPYAALSVPPFVSTVKVPHATPVLVYMPDDPRLGRFRADYGNLFGSFEEREPGGNGKKTYNTEDLEKKLKQDNDNTVDEKAVLTARLLDMFIMDFDRHEDQWRWLAVDNGKGKTFSPVPRDRDQPFFINEGVIPWLAGSAWAVPQLQGFRAKARNIKTFNHNARNFDRNYMSELTEKDWREGAEAVLALMTDSLIEAALHLQPASVQPYHMASIIATLKERRKFYIQDVMQYYRFLTNTVSIYGSDKKELFDVSRKDDGSVTVTVSKVNKEGEPGKKIFERTFAPGETKELRLFGMGGEDKFLTHGNGSGRIKVRMIGGPGADLFQNEAESPAGSNRIYDLSTEKNEISGKGHYRNFLSSDPAVNAVNKLGFKYNIIAPLATIGYNPDDGVSIGAGFRYTSQGFHKEPYKQLHSLMVTHALATNAWAFKYNFEAIDAIGKLDLIAHANARAPNNTINFFGLGNETIYLKNVKDGIRYYRARFTVYDLDLQLRKRFGPGFSLAAGPVIQHFSVDSADNQDRFINQNNVPGVDHATLYNARTYVGGRASAILDLRNDKVIPTRGLYWENHYSNYGGTNEQTHHYSQLKSDLSLYTGFNSRGNVVLSTRVGWGKTFGDDNQFYQAQFLGATDNLRGYRKFRFAGDELFFNNVDLRVRLGEFNTYLFPGNLGLTFFNDVGRVWQKGEKSDSWHDGYGGGVWISALKLFVLSATYGQGTEGGVVLVKLGFQY